MSKMTTANKILLATLILGVVTLGLGAIYLDQFFRDPSRVCCGIVLVLGTFFSFCEEVNTDEN